jgi:hypothetical protein
MLSTMRRPAPLAALVGALALALWAARMAPPARLPGPPPALAFWEWSGRERLPPPVLAGLDGLGCQELFAWCGSVEWDGSGPVWRLRGAVPALPRALALHLVVRCEASVAAHLGEDGEALAAVIAAGCRERAQGHGVAGLQIDCDVPVRSLPAYAALLRALRPRLPGDWRLGATMLLSWRGAAGFAAVGAAVDELVPQCYSTTPATPDGPLVQGGDLPATVAALEGLGIAYRIGLPTFAQTALFRGGRLLAPAVPLDLASLLQTGLPLQAIHEPGGRGVRARCPGPCSLGVADLHAGDVLHAAMPTVAGLAARLAELRGLEAPHCRGVVLFRLPAAETTPTLSLAQVRAALAGTVHPATMVLELAPDPVGWTLRLSNPGDEDWLELDHPLRLRLDGCGAAVSAPAGMALEPIRDGRPCAALHADGVRLTLRLLAAGDVATVSGRGPPPRLLRER